MAFCGKCGSEIKEGNAFCQNCGNAVTGVNVDDINTPIKNRSKNKLVGLIAGILAIVIVTVGAVTIFGGDKPEEVAIKFAEATIYSDYDNLLKYSAFDAEKYLNDIVDYLVIEDYDDEDEMFEELEDDINQELEDYDKEVRVNNIRDLFKARKLLIENELEYEYGDYDINIEIDEIKKLTRSEIREEIEDYEDGMVGYLNIDDYMDSSKIKEGYKITLEATIDTDNKSETDDISYFVVKYKGAWKVLENWGLY